MLLTELQLCSPVPNNGILFAEEFWHLTMWILLIAPSAILFWIGTVVTMRQPGSKLHQQDGLHKLASAGSEPLSVGGGEQELWEGGARVFWSYGRGFSGQGRADQGWIGPRIGKGILCCILSSRLGQAVLHAAAWISTGYLVKNQVAP